MNPYSGELRVASGMRFSKYSTAESTAVEDSEEKVERVFDLNFLFGEEEEGLHEHSWWIIWEGGLLLTARDEEGGADAGFIAFSPEYPSFEESVLSDNPILDFIDLLIQNFGKGTWGDPRNHIELDLIKGGRITVCQNPDVSSTLSTLYSYMTVPF